MPLTADSEIKRLLEQSRTVAVVGYSDRPNRPSNGVAHALERFGYEVYKVNPALEPDSEHRIYASLRDIPVQIDIVDIFGRPEFVPPVVEEAIAIHAKAVWMQLGIVNEVAAQRAEQAGLLVVMDHCMKVEYGRLIGAANHVHAS